MPTSIESDNISTLSAGAKSSGEIIDGYFYNLIPSRFPPVDVYARLTDNDGFQATCKKIEDLTNPRLRMINRMNIDADAGNKKSRPYQNWNHAPYAYGNTDGTTFFGAHYPALELYSDKQTALAVAVSRRGNFLRATNQESQGVDLRMFKRSVTGVYADAPFDPEDKSQKERWEFGEGVVNRGLNGVTFNPGERPAGKAIAVLDNSLLGKTDQCEHFRCTWDGKKIRTLYNFQNGTAIDVSALGDELDALG